MKFGSLVCGVAVVLATASVGHSAIIFEDDFETAPNNGPGQFGNPWVVLATGFGTAGSENANLGTDGPVTAFFNVDSVSTADIFIDTGDAAAAGDYTLSFDNISRVAVFANQYDGTMTASLVAWDGVGDVRTDSTTILSGIPDYTNLPVAGQFNSNTFTGTLAAPAAGNVYVLFETTENTNTTQNSNSFSQPLIDNVGVDFVTAVPEPSSLAAMGLIGGVAAWRRRCR